MSETFGSLVDKISTCNIKLFMVQQAVHEAAQAGEGLEPEVVQKLHALNLQRNALMTELDLCLRDAVKSGEAIVDPRVKLV